MSYTSMGGSGQTLPPQPAAAAPTGVLYLEKFLDSVLKQSLHTVLQERDDIRSQASACHQLRQLIVEMSGLSRHSTHLTSTTSSSPEKGGETAQTPSSSSSSSPPTGLSQRAAADSYVPPQRNTILVDLGNRFYTQGVIKDPGTVHIHLGCGVVLPMTTEKANGFLIKKEKTLRDMAMRKTREAMRLTYRIRLVTEAIAGLNQKHMGL